MPGLRYTFLTPIVFAVVALAFLWSTKGSSLFGESDFCANWLGVASQPGAARQALMENVDSMDDPRIDKTCLMKEADALTSWLTGRCVAGSDSERSLLENFAAEARRRCPPRASEGA